MSCTISLIITNYKLDSHPETALKKAALNNRSGTIRDIAQWVSDAADSFNQTQDALFADRLQPALNGIFDQAFEGVANRCAADQVGRNLALELVQNPTAVRVRVFEAGLFAVVARVLTERNTQPGYTDQEITMAVYNDLAISLKQLSETYIRLRPTAESGTLTPLENFLDPLWRIQLGTPVDTALDQSANALRELLKEVNNPVAALQFISNLVQTTTEVVSLNQGSTKAVNDAWFLRELVAFGFQYAKLNPIDLPDAVNNGTIAFLNTIQKADKASEIAKQQATGKFAELFKGLDTNQERVQMMEFGDRLLRAIEGLPQEMQGNDPRLSSALIALGGAYAALNPTDI